MVNKLLRSKLASLHFSKENNKFVKYKSSSFSKKKISNSFFSPREVSYCRIIKLLDISPIFVLNSSLKLYILFL